jgi:zinc transport system substrate-binding protein
MKTSNLFSIFLCVAVISAILVSCGTKEGERGRERKLKVVTTLFPLYDFARNVGGDKAEVILLLPPGVEPHSFEPRPGDVLAVNEADLFIYTGREMEPWVEGILKGLDNKKPLVLDASRGITIMENEHGRSAHGHGEGEKGHGHEGRLDPHIWLDLSNAEKMVENIRDRFMERDPVHKEDYRKSAEFYSAKLADLDKSFKTSLSVCARRIFIHGGHFAFAYLAKRYDLQYISAYEGSPNAEPTPRRIVELKKLVKDKGIRYVYYEELITPRVAEVLAQETGTGLLRLHGAHNISREDLEKGATFISIMEQNLKNLRTGLECQ